MMPGVSSAVLLPSQLIKHAPLAALPNGTLVRSTMIAAVSSKKALLVPTLMMLSFISKPNRGFLFHPEKNPFVHAILKNTFYNQFCAGETQAEARKCVQGLKDLGFKGVIMTYARETVVDHKSNSAYVQGVQSPQDLDAKSSETSFRPDIDEWRIGTLKTIDTVEEGDMLALKLSGGGSLVTHAFASGQPVPKQFMDALYEICAKCKDRSIRVIVDAESQAFQKGIAAATLELMSFFNRDGAAVVFCTYQAYLKQTPKVIAEHLEAASQQNFTLGLKLVRGAYMNSDDRSLIHDTKQITDDAYNGIATGALKRQLGLFGDSGSKPFPSVNLFLASHNRESVMKAHRLHQQRVKLGLPTIPVGFGQLHGMSDEVSFRLLSEKDENEKPPEVYKCSTWGSMTECLAYMLRRAVENRDSVLRSSDEYKALKSEMWRRIKSKLLFSS